MTTGIGAFFSSFCVCALNALQNSMMLRPRGPSAGPIGGEGFAAPAGTCNFRYPVTFFAICHSSCCSGRSGSFTGPWCGSMDDWRSSISSHGCLEASPPPLSSCPDVIRATTSRSDLLDLSEFQFDRRGAPEDRHRDLDARARLVDFLDHAGERCERPIGYPHILADLEGDRRLRAFDAFLHLMQDPHRFGFRDRHRLVFRAEEARDL